MKIEILYPEICNLFGDTGNMKYLKKCLPEAEFVSTSFGEKPLFAEEKPALIYLAPSNEKNQELIIKALLPYRNRIKELIDNGTPMLFTGNSGEVLFKEIEDYDGRKIPALDLLPFTAKRMQYTRFNGLNHGTMADDTEILGFRSQFTYWYGDNSDCYFTKCIKGIGINKESDKEGIMVNNAVITAQLGPVLVNNPAFTKRLLKLMGAKNATLAFEEDVKKAFEIRKAEFENPKTKFIL